MTTKNLLKTGLAGLLFATVLLASCTPMITPEQLKQLGELRSEEISLKANKTKAQNDRSKLQKDLSARQAELKKCEDDKKFVEDKLSQWPNVWR
jgi:septal ring factor EnvC (AmiA/AmiB activator)